MRELENKLGYSFKNKRLLETALTHSSFANENKRDSNERLEFLGDSVLGMTVALHLYREYGHMPEGRMTILRAELVCEKNLVTAAGKLGMGEHLRLGRGEELCGGRTRPSILADTMEALLAAVFLDAGEDGAKTVAGIVERYILSPVLLEEKRSSDFKTMLQENIQRKNGQALSYRLIGEKGPDHEKIFMVEVMLNDKVIGAGEGRSKKEAEQKAAEAGLGNI